MQILLILTAVLAAVSAAPELYDGCGTDKGCFGIPENCVDDGNCEVFASYTANDDGTYAFELFADGEDAAAGWIGVGFSNDPIMGSDGAQLCTAADGVRTFNLIGYPKGAKLREGDPSEGISNVGVSEDGADTLYCSFDRVAAIDQTDLSGEYHLQLARGPLKDDGNPGRHAVRAVTEEKVGF